MTTCEICACTPADPCTDSSGLACSIAAPELVASKGDYVCSRCLELASAVAQQMHRAPAPLGPGTFGRLRPFVLLVSVEHAHQARRRRRAARRLKSKAGPALLAERFKVTR